MDENIQAQSPEVTEPAAETAEQPAEQYQFSDEDLAFAQWSLMLGAYMQSLLQEPTRAADELEAAAKALREMYQPHEQPAQPPQPSQSAQPAQPVQQPDINALVQQAVEQAVGKMFEQLKKQALASPAGVAGKAVSSKRLADLIE